MTAASTPNGRPPGATRTWLTILRELYDRVMISIVLILAAFLFLLA